MTFSYVHYVISSLSINDFQYFQAAFLLEEGALPSEIDQVIEDFGIPIGPFKVGDLSGKKKC